MSKITTASMSRRSFVAGAIATSAAIAMAANSLRDPMPAFADDIPEPDEDTTGAVSGGTVSYYLTNPVGIEPYTAEENQGVEVVYNLFDTLVSWDWGNECVQPLAAESWEVNDDATQFTFHLRKDAKFHNGQPVTSKDFKYSWERNCSAATVPAPSSQGYKINMIGGANDMMAGTGTELAVECPDDYTLVVNLDAPYGDFLMQVCDPSTAPVPAGCADTDEDYQKFRVAPIGNGPFKMNGEWVDGQYIPLVRNDDYWGEKPFIDGVTFMIFSNDQTAWTEFQAGNLDFTQVPSGMFDLTRQMYGEAEKDGYLANPDHSYFSGSEISIYYILCNDFTQVPSGMFDLTRQMYGEAEKDGYLANPDHSYFSGSEISIYYILCNNKDEIMSNRDLRIAISCAINRQAICDIVFQGSRVPADNMLMPGLAAYEPGVWGYCPAEGDAALANEYFDKAGYPAAADGKRDLTITLSCNPGSSNETIMQMVQADLANYGVTANIEVQEWAAYLDACQTSNYQIGRMGWVLSTPNTYTVLNDLFYTGLANNYSGYTNPEFDAMMDAARQIPDEEERTLAYKEANGVVGEDFPVIPLMYYAHYYVASNRVHNLFLTPGSLTRLWRCWIG